MDGRLSFATACVSAMFAVVSLGEDAVSRQRLSETVGDRVVDFELATGPADLLRVAVAPDEDGDGPGVLSLADPTETAGRAGLSVAVNANAFRKLDRGNHEWRAGDPVIPFGEVVADSRYVDGCEQKRLVFYVDSTNVCHIGRNPDFSRVRAAVSDWGGCFLKGGLVDGNAAVATYPRSVIGHDATGRKAFLMVGFMSLAEAAEILRRHGASDAMNLDGGGSAVMVPAADGRSMRPVPVVIGFAKR